MKKELRYYSVTPGVVCVGEKSVITVTPLDSGLYFSDTKEYEIDVLPMTRRRLHDTPDFILRGQGGVLKFSYLFDNEEEYYIRIYQRSDDMRGKLIVTLSVYAVLPDLYDLRPLKGDLHIHTIRSDGKEEPGIVAANYRTCGYDFIAITDHNRYFPSVEAQEVFKNFSSGLNILNGEEVHTPDTYIHIIHIGGKYSVTEKYIKHREEYEAEIAEIESNLPAREDNFYIARTRWAVENIRKAGGLSIFVHPYWIPKKPYPKCGIYNLTDNLIDCFFKSELFDAYELIGAMVENGGNNRSVAKYADMRAEGISLPIVGCSDSHGTIGYPRFNEYYTILLAKENTDEAIIESIKNGLSVAVETISGTCGQEYIVHGSYRLTSYIRYLIDHYFPLYTKICECEGLFIREYLLGYEETPDIIGICAKKAENFYKRFFGKIPAVLPTQRAIESSEKWSDVWQEYGVVKRGSTLV
ncbi:MAG: hypothetical protein GX303_03060 [Clostridiales bacterium]|nr:hypothetical protein [Clostridiales bacterium]